MKEFLRIAVQGLAVSEGRVSTPLPGKLRRPPRSSAIGAGTYPVAGTPAIGVPPGMRPRCPRPDRRTQRRSAVVLGI